MWILPEDIFSSPQTHSVSICIPAVELLSFGFSLNHRVHGLQVGGVCHQRQSDVPVRHAVDPTMVHSQVVLDVSGALRWRNTAGQTAGSSSKTKILV